MCHSRRTIGPTTRRVLRCAAPAPEALTDITGEASWSGSKAVLPCDLLRLVIDGRHWSEPPVRAVVYTRTWDFRGRRGREPVAGRPSMIDRDVVSPVAGPVHVPVRRR